MNYNQGRKALLETLYNKKKSKKTDIHESKEMINQSNINQSIQIVGLCF